VKAGGERGTVQIVQGVPAVPTATLRLRPDGRSRFNVTKVGVRQEATGSSPKKKGGMIHRGRTAGAAVEKVT
jgi:hypothetical protein